MSGAYFSAGRAAAYEDFQRRALDPAGSVVISACAGAGKTTLLVGRIVRALLDGCAPDEVLAVTFTRKAAAEMRKRLMESLRQLALADEAVAGAMLRDFALPSERVRARLPDARALYERVLTHPRPPTISTFHSWFWQLVRLAPLASGVPLDADLAEDTAAMADEARQAWLDRLRLPEHDALRADVETLAEQLGGRRLETALQAALKRRVELLAATDDPGRADPEQCRQAAERMGQDAWAALAEAVQRSTGCAVEPHDASLAAALRTGGTVRAELLRFASLLGQGGATCVKIAASLVVATQALDDPAVPIDACADLVRRAVLTKDKARTWKLAKKDSQAFVAAIDRAGGEPACQAAWASLGERVADWTGLVDDLSALAVNARLMRVAADRIAHFQAWKRVRRAVDFGDVELMAAQLVRDESMAAFVQARLDARYRQILFDEFQDTNALQWQIVSDWLSSYAGDADRPSVFVVGDIKQAIYRFRRADSRVFDAARTLLVRDFDAADLATDTTWRIAPAVLERINACLGEGEVAMTGYRRHATRRDEEGFVWRLPLADGEGEDEDGAAPGGEGGPAAAGSDPAGAEDEPGPAAGGAMGGQPATDDAAQAPPVAARDWFTEPRARDARHRQFVEGLQIARALHAAKARLESGGRTLQWRDVLVLARRRAHFARYEHALRTAGIPVVSDRAGGLLDRLEVADMMSLLRWLWQPDDDLALAQVLKCPLFGVPDEALSLLARGRDASLWARLAAMFGDPLGPDPLGPAHDLFARADDASRAALREAHDQLVRWTALVRVSPVHDLVDRVIADRDAYARYAAVVPPAQREVVRANLDALLALALDVDGGRYPSLPAFLAAVRRMRRLDDQDAPSEGAADGLDAVRLMTIHGAKGLEADIVVVADANGALRSEGGWRPIVGWHPLERAPRHVSFVDGSRRHPSRRAWLDEESQLARAEDWNLLYVALTRAKRALIISGARNDRAHGDNWWARLAPIEIRSLDDIAASSLPLSGLGSGDGGFDWWQYRPGWIGVGVRAEQHDESSVRATALGEAMHRAIEVLSGVPGADDALALATMVEWPLTAAERARALALARKVLGLPALSRCFDGSGRAVNEMDVFDAQGRLLRVDRFVEFDDEAWVIDWKWSIAEHLREDYREQLAGYRAALAPLVGRRRLRTLLVDARAGRVEVDPDLDGARFSARPDTDPLGC